MVTLAMPAAGDSILSTDEALVGTVPARHSCQLFNPSPSGLAKSAEPLIERPYCCNQAMEIREAGVGNSWQPISTVPPIMRVFPPKSKPAGANELLPELMQGEVAWR